MPFNISSYIDGLQRSLEKLPPQARVAFAAWCNDLLFSQEVRDFLAAKIGPVKYSAVEQALNCLWKCASTYELVGHQVIPVADACASIGWADEDIADDEQDTNIYAIEAASSLCNALDACKTGSAFSAAKCAECVLNRLDWQLSDKLLASEHFTPRPKWKAELERQEKMLAFLQNRPGLTEGQRRMFRE